MRTVFTRPLSVISFWILAAALSALPLVASAQSFDEFDDDHHVERRVRRRGRGLDDGDHDDEHLVDHARDAVERRARWRRSRVRRAR